MIKRLASVAWIIVVSVALAVSNWSLAVVGHHFGLPYTMPPLAWVLSIIFDGAALIAGSLTLRSARELGSNGSASRAFVFILAGTSAWLNSEHASLLNLGLPARIMYAAPPIVSITLFELTTRFEYRTALQKAGRTVEPLPVFGTAAWLFHPLGSLSDIWHMTGLRKDTRRAIYDAATKAEGMAAESSLKEAAAVAKLTGVSAKSAIATARTYLGEAATTAAIQDWLAQHGVSVTTQYIGQLRNDSNGSVPKGSTFVMPASPPPRTEVDIR